MDPDLRSQINAVLIRDGHVNKIQGHLLHSLHAHPNNWPTQIQTRALYLLRTGAVTTFPALVTQILDEVRRETAASSSTTLSQTNGRPHLSSTASHNSSTSASSATIANSNSSNNAVAKGDGSTNGHKKPAAPPTSAAIANGNTSTSGAPTSTPRPSNGAPGPGEASNLHRDTASTLALPRSVVSEALRLTREALESICELENPTEEEGDDEEDEGGVGSEDG